MNGAVLTLGTFDGMHCGHQAVLAEVSRSTTEKTEEIIQLRADVLKLCREQLIECAGAMARSFVAGGRLFAFTQPTIPAGIR